jgi:hypothetical protein
VTNPVLQSVWAEIRNGKIETLENVTLPEGAKAIVTILLNGDDTWFWLSASEQSLANIWDNTEDNVYASLLLEEIS